ncbi:putative FBD-associated F-box protein At5g56390 [Rhododendron vialii]|uniref:putative FBD-associated F-box protein At5g56390 n=1 Tax=Rhododendron vialii TaxID=182163 RepID=UPI00265F0DEC|nr:putative FBD-associated F-box protein At5g56390 [Rhododendron vialii]
MFWVLEVPRSTQFSNLKTLKLSNVTFSDDNSTQHLFSSCPVLQELALLNCGWENLKTITICIPSLKSLTIDNNYEFLWPEDVLSCVTKIYAANLIHLDCFCCLIVDFRLYDLSLLVEASICLYEDLPEQDVTPRVLGLLTGISNIKKLTVTSQTLEYLTPVANLLDRLLVFYNMTHLVLHSELFGDSFRVMIDLLENSPKLESLNFEEGFNPFVEDDWMLGRVPSCFAPSLKTVRIADFDKKPVEMHFIRFLLKNATVLERLTLHSYSQDLIQQQQKVSSQLNKLPRGSKSCVIEFTTT